MWIDENLLISDTNANRDYTTAQFNNLFATIRVAAKADMQDVKYYSSFGDAVTAINSETYTSSLERADAKVGIYTDLDDSSVNLALYDDLDLNASSYTIIKPVNINLYGHEMEFHKVENAYMSMIALTNTTNIENGTITAESWGGSNTYPFVVASSGGNITINNVNFPYISEYNGMALSVAYGGSLIIKNSSVLGEVQSNVSNGSYYKLVNSHIDGYITINDTSIAEFNDSYIEHSHSPINNLVTINNTASKLIVNNSTILADSPGCYYNGNASYSEYMCTMGIINSGTLIFNSGYVFGTNTAVGATNGSKTYVYGGTFESTHHGGFYLTHGPSGVAYIENANINATYSALGKYRPNGTVDRYVSEFGYTYELDEYKTAFYIGGDSSQNNESVYMVNCNISSGQSPLFVMRYSTPYQNLYMSGCNFLNTTADYVVRIDEPTHMKLYYGYNNNFGLINKFGSNSSPVSFAEAKAAGTIVQTNADYKNIVSPE